MEKDETPSVREGNVAVFVDGDNATQSLLKPILEELSRYGTPTIRRIYGDWTSQNMQSWKQVILEHAFQPRQQYNVAKGKNSTDAALIIDAMDVLFGSDAGTFCIVSSDSDYTPLAMRLREGGKFVVGVGERKTPNSLVNSCHVFIYTENLTPGGGGGGGDGRRGRTPQKPRATTGDNGAPMKVLERAYELCEDESGWAELGHLGNKLIDIDPGFDPRSYGHKKLLDLLKATGRFDVQVEQKGGPSPVYIRLKE